MSNDQPKQRLSPPPDEGLLRRVLTGKENETPTKQSHGAKFVGRSTVLRSPFRNLGNATCNSQTPPKRINRWPDPITPTTNFKMLSSVAASLEYAGSDSISNSSDCEAIKVGDSFSEMSGMNPFSPLETKLSRKERSLSFICSRFLSLYPEYPEEVSDYCVSIDEVAADLGVERRRMYDIANVLESIDVVRKVAKNKYQYYGKRNLLSSLKALCDKAAEENVQEQLRLSFRPLIANVLKEPATSVSDFTPFRQEKTLGAISQKFLMLFLCTIEPCTISLQQAAQVLMGVMKIEKDTVQFKTKIRRLYDIANIYASVGLIEKDSTKSKQSFKYIGPDVTYLRNLPANSLLQGNSDALNLKFSSFNNGLKLWASNATKSVSKFPRTRSDSWDLQPKKKAKTLVRHLSLHDICAVAEVEREKLYTSLSMPPSPVEIHPVKSEPQNLTSRSILRKPLFPNFITPNESTASIRSLSSPVPVHHSEQVSVIQDKKPHVCKLVRKEILSGNVHQLVPVNLERKLDSQKIISLTPEQKSNILKFIDVSLQDGQVATILISGSSNGVNINNTANSQIPELHKQAC